MITFQVETWANYSGDPEVWGLWKEEHEEARLIHQDRMELAPDLVTYELMDRAGLLFILTARNSGRLVGYCLAVIRRHMHYPTICGFEDTFFLTASERKGMVGINLIKACLEGLKARGCKRVYWMCNNSPDVGPILERLGMEKLSSSYSIWLEN